MSGCKRAKREFKMVYEEYELEVKSFDVRMTAGINVTPESPAILISLEKSLYHSSMQLDITTECIKPKRFKGEDCIVKMRNYFSGEEWKTLRVADVQRKDANGAPQYFKRGQELIPDFESPSSIGWINSNRRHGPRFAHVSVPFYVVQDFRSALSLGVAPRIFMGVERTGFDRLIQNVSYSTPGLYEI